jgi:hypothetical protein
MRIIKYTSLLLIVYLVSLGASAQSIQSDSLLFDHNDLISLHKRISIGASAGKRSSDLSINMGLQLLTYINWKKIDLGLGVNYEDEDYFNLLPAYFHLAYTPAIQGNKTKIMFQSGLAFNLPQSANYDYGKPGVMLSVGIEQPFKLFKKLPANFQILYRYQETSTVREWAVAQQADQSNINTEVIKHFMHRFMLVYGMNF